MVDGRLQDRMESRWRAAQVHLVEVAEVRHVKGHDAGALDDVGSDVDTGTDGDVDQAARSAEPGVSPAAEVADPYWGRRDDSRQRQEVGVRVTRAAKAGKLLGGFSLPVTPKMYTMVAAFTTLTSR